MQVMMKYMDAIRKTLDKVNATQTEAMEKAADMLADATLHDRNIFAFGCNHAGLLALEMYYRTGGMVNINPVRGPGLQLDVDPATLTSQMERLPCYGRILMEQIPLEQGDVVMIHSVSGRNPVTVDAALYAREKGATVIALTNMATTKAVSSRHESGKSLFQVAHLVIDNCGCVGDAAVEIPGTAYQVGPTSTAVGAAILNAIVVEAVSKIKATGRPAPVFVSANLDGGDEHNRRVMEDYREHIFYM